VTVLAVAVLLAGAEPEELLTAALAAAQDRPGLAAGDAIGANVTMLTAALGLAALVRPLPLGRRTRLYAGGSAAAGLLALLALVGGGVTRLEGGLLLGAYAVLVALVWAKERQPPAIGEVAEVAEEGPADRRVTTALVLVVAGLVGSSCSRSAECGGAWGAGGDGARAVGSGAVLILVLDRCREELLREHDDLYERRPSDGAGHPGSPRPRTERAERGRGWDGA
jgi:hypothetical protein